jgi:disulfide bond formation protein DsbB
MQHFITRFFGGRLIFRTLALAGFVTCVALMTAALYFQYVSYLEPCPLCIIQRWFVMAVGAVLLAVALHNPGGWGWKVYGGLTVLLAAGGAAVAARHVQIQHTPPDQLPGCGADFDTMLEMFPLLKTFALAWAGTSDCATVTWRFLGLGMPAWVLIFFAGFAALGLYFVFAKRPPESG